MLVVAWEAGNDFGWYMGVHTDVASEAIDVLPMGVTQSLPVSVLKASLQGSICIF